MRIENKQIFFVDINSLMYQELGTLFDTIGLKTRIFSNPVDCLNHLSVQECDLLIVNYEIPGMNGIELMKKAKSLNPSLPTIITADNACISIAVLAIKEGATDFLVKPIDLKMFETTISKILQNSHLYNLRDISLTKMEKLVMNLIITGKNNKEIAFLLNRSRRTIENHHYRLMKKLNSHNCAELYKKVCFNNIVKLENDSLDDYHQSISVDKSLNNNFTIP
jgi:two-component system, LuxR family, response regulator FixJ